jgi:hypothetical protein
MLQIRRLPEAVYCFHTPAREFKKNSKQIQNYNFEKAFMHFAQAKTLFPLERLF